jgi:hypothetical protein
MHRKKPSEFGVWRYATAALCPQVRQVAAEALSMPSAICARRLTIQPGERGPLLRDARHTFHARGPHFQEIFHAELNRAKKAATK